MYIYRFTYYYPLTARKMHILGKLLDNSFGL